MEYTICECCGKPKKKVVGNGSSGKTAGMQNLGPSGIKGGEYDITAPATDLARTWAGHRYGLQALKPAIETVLIFQKPYEGRPIDNITQTGAGALNIEGARIPSSDGFEKAWDVPVRTNISQGGGAYGTGVSAERGTRLTDLTKYKPSGRWPSNFYLGDVEAARRLDEQSGTLTSPRPYQRKSEELGNPRIYGSGKGIPMPSAEGNYGDSGGASRFFFRVAEQIDDADPVRYVAKASRAERDAGLEGMPLIELKTHGEMGVDASGNSHNTTGQKPALARNPHPTVKPLALCKYLATLLLPPAEYAPRRLFVPFSGVASEAIGAMQAGWEHIEGVEITEEYLPIARARVEYWQKQVEQRELPL